MKSIVITIFCLIIWAELEASQETQFGPEPGWVRQISIPTADNIPVEQVQYGAHYLAFDRQVLVESNQEPEYYYRYLTKIINLAGLDDQSQVNVRFDPVFESVVFHKLEIIRGGKRLDKLPTSTIKYLQQEDDLESQLYNGETTLNILIDDLRVDDLIDYSYTITGRNPVFNNLFSANLKLQWGVPITLQNLRLVWRKNVQLTYEIFNSNLPIKVQKTDLGVEYTLVEKNVQPLRVEDNSPDWVSPYARVEFTEITDWGQVVLWGSELFNRSSQKNTTLSSVVDSINLASVDRNDKIANTLKFVQEEIRYVGIEFGENSHRPSVPETTLNRRYGDCKDKTTLMVTILKELGIEAYPALVNTYDEDEVRNYLPSTSVFNHVLVAVPDGDNTYWFDPTRIHQKGSLEHIYQPDYGQALILDAKSKGFVSMDSKGVGSGYDIYERFNLVPNSSKLMTFTVNTEYFGASAEREIGRFERDDKKQIEKDYLDFYKDYYPQIELDYIENKGVDPDNFRMKVEERYNLLSFWEREESSGRDVGWFYSSSINSLLSEPEDKVRQHDYKLAYPWKVNHTIKLALPDEQWNLSNSKFVEDNPFFKFSQNVEFKNDSNIVYVSFSYESKTDHVKPEEFEAYLQAIENVSPNLDYGIYYHTEPDPQFFDQHKGLIFISLFLGVLLLSILLWLRDVKRNPYTGDMLYYPMNEKKFFFMWVMTFGIFPIYWFYKNWKFENEYRSTNDILPGVRGFFYYFFYYSLYKTLRLNFSDKLSSTRYPSSYQMIFLAVILFGLALVSGRDDVLSLPLLIASAIVALPVLKMINFINKPNDRAEMYNSKWSFRHILLVFIFLPLFMVSDGAYIGLLPSSKVVTGNKLLSHDVKFLQRADVLEPSDKIAYFYSDATWTVRDDGNGFTERHVFSYWKDDAGAFNIDTVLFEDIESFNVIWSTGFTENTILEVFRADQSRVVLYISADDNKDKLFINQFKIRLDSFD